MTEVNNTYDEIFSRDVFDRVGELELELEGLESGLDNLDCVGGKVDVAIDELKDEWKPLRDFADELIDASPDAPDGIAVIRDSYFTEYAQDLAEDIVAIDYNANWPFYHIDWDAAADSLKQDYTEVDFDGVAYFIRSV